MDFVPSVVDIIVDRWSGEDKPHPHPMHNPTPLPTQTHTQKALKSLVFPLVDSITSTDQRNNGPTDRPTDGQSLL